MVRPEKHRQSSQTERRLLRLRSPYGDPPYIVVSIDGDGKYVPDDPGLGGPFRTIEGVHHEAYRRFLAARREGRDRASPPLPPPCDEEHVEGTAEPASAQTPQKPDVSFLAELLDATSLEEPPSRRCLSSSLGSTIWVRDPPDWYMKFYIRMDLGGSFHIYPDLGGPFRSLQEADDAINRHLHDLRRPEMFKEQDEVSLVEGMIRRSLYWPDGTRKKRGSKSQASENTNNQECQLVQVLVDQYNEDHNLFGDLAYELKDVVHYQSICEGDDYRWYDHVNFTTKTKGADAFDCGINNLFFAEVTHARRR